MRLLYSWASSMEEAEAVEIRFEVTPLASGCGIMELKEAKRPKIHKTVEPRYKICI